MVHSWTCLQILDKGGSDWEGLIRKLTDYDRKKFYDTACWNNW